MNADLNLIPAAKYRVKIRGQSRARTRIFKWRENRFGEIPCFVFTSPVPAQVQASWDHATRTLTMTNVPHIINEVSVPHYDLMECEAVT